MGGGGGGGLEWERKRQRLAPLTTFVSNLNFLTSSHSHCFHLRTVKLGGKRVGRREKTECYFQPGAQMSVFNNIILCKRIILHV